MKSLIKALFNIRYLRLYIAHFVLILLCMIILIPFFWMIQTSFKSVEDLISSPHSLLFTPSIRNYRTVFEAGLLRYFLNSLIIAGATTIAGAVIGIPAGYSLARFNFKGRDTLAFAVLGLRFIPFVVIALPLYLLMVQLGFVGTRIGMIIGYQIIVLPLMVWLCKVFFEQIPRELEEAGRVDGCDRLKSFYLIALPVIAPSIGATLVLGFIWSWNHFLIALMLSTLENRPLTLGIQQFLASEFVGAQWGALSAWSTIITVPVVLLAIAINKYLVRGFGGASSN